MSICKNSLMDSAICECPACYSAPGADAHSLQRPCSAHGVMTVWQIEYEHDGKCWFTVVEAYDRDHALEVFRRDNPHIKEIRGCE